MKLIQILAPIAGLLAAVNADDDDDHESTIWTTVYTTDFTTYCPSPTTFAWKNVTYTATTATTITITNCPCTITYSQPPPITTTSCPETTIPSGTGGITTYPNATSTTITFTPPPETTISGTVPITSPTKTPVGPSTSSPVVIPTAAAEKVGPIGALLAIGMAALAL
ncbi:hypothetical protein F4779DRAFT_575031 [Xylariaceae sp. FL0662B]|nr:hypothetical protein F4779DRAFT_575031 [Xylariaceae sp. FL0662B]